MNLKINSRQIGTGYTYVIAEIGNNHNGSFDRAISMIDSALASGADCVKFQMRNLSEVYRKRSLDRSGEDLGTEYIVDLLSRFELSIEKHRKLFNYCYQQGIDYLCTPWDQRSVAVLEDFGVRAYKVASADLTNLHLLEVLALTKKPLILSTGMSLIHEVRETVTFLNERSVKYALLHCNSTYPAPFVDINLNWIEELYKVHPFIGYSGHERGTNVSIAAVALGACIIERHFTLDRQMEGPDHAASLVESEFRQMVDGIREVELALGTSQERKLSQGEIINRENLGKSLIAARPLKIGTVITAEDVRVRSPGQGLSPQKLKLLLGCTLARNMREEDFFYPSDLFGLRIEPRSYVFERPWGLPIRYHDFKEYAERVTPDLWEFHLSYSDMELNPEAYLNSTYPARFSVHAPELFSGSRLMDLAAPDEAYRKECIGELKRVIDITRKLKQYFPKEERPMIITNVGGFSMDKPIPRCEVRGSYERIEESLAELNLDGVNLIPQTMAPFPWHLGGQRYHNLFLDAEEIIEWSNTYKLKICLDVSHSFLACNHFKKNFYHFVEKVAPMTAHLHIGDAAGLNGEGLQIGDGDIDFVTLGAILKKYCPTASFIPEIWQGHKNGGEGFWLALDRLEGNL